MPHGSCHAQLYNTAANVVLKDKFQEIYVNLRLTLVLKIFLIVISVSNVVFVLLSFTV